jgi:phage tail sheath gpL-like
LIVTNIPDSNRGGISYHIFNCLLQAGALVSIPLRGALIGTMRSTGTATAGVVYDVTGFTNEAVDALFGQSSEIATMYRMCSACATLFQRGPRLYAVGLAEPGGGTANIQTLTLTGNASTDGPWQITIAGRTFKASAKTGDTPTTQATNMVAIIAAVAATLPVLVTSAAGVISITHPTKGVNGADIKVTIDQQVTGTGIALATTAAGVGTSDASVAFTSLSPLRYDGMAFGNHDATLTTEIVADIATRWSASSKTWGYYYIGEPGSTGTATTLAAAINHQAGEIASIPSSPLTAGELAAGQMMLVCSRAKASASFDKATVPFVPPATAQLLTGTQIETSIAAGLTVYEPVIDSTGAVTANRMQCNRMVTAKTTTSGQPDPRNRDISVSRTGIALAIQLEAATAIALGADTNPDGVAQDDDTDQLIVDLAAAILRAEAAAGIIRKKFVDQDIAGIRVEHDGTTLGRDNTLIPYHAITPLHQIAWVHLVQIGG